MCFKTQGCESNLFTKVGEISLMKGTVKWFNPKKGYGFITTEEGQDIFVHYSSIASEGYKSLNEGDNVEFEVATDEKGSKAKNVKKI